MGVVPVEFIRSLPTWLWPVATLVVTGGALALLFVLDKKSYMSSTSHSLALVAANVALLLLCAAIINNLIPGRRYPWRPGGSGCGNPCFVVNE